MIKFDLNNRISVTRITNKDEYNDIISEILERSIGKDVKMISRIIDNVRKYTDKVLRNDVKDIQIGSSIFDAGINIGFEDTPLFIDDYIGSVLFTLSGSKDNAIDIDNLSEDGYNKWITHQGSDFVRYNGYISSNMNKPLSKVSLSNRVHLFDLVENSENPDILRSIDNKTISSILSFNINIILLVSEIANKM